MAAIAVTTTAQQLPSGIFTIRNEGAVNCRLGNTASDASDANGMKLAAGEVFPNIPSNGIGGPLWIRCETGTCDVRIVY